jgi:hypothetical protein
MLTLFSGSQALTQSQARLIYEVNGVCNLGEANSNSYNVVYLKELLGNFDYEREIFEALLNRFGSNHKWKKFSFISEDQVSEFQLKDADIHLNFSSESLAATGTVSISVAGDMPGNLSFINYLGKILKIMIERVIKDRFEGVTPIFKISFAHADTQRLNRLPFLKR